MRIFLVLLLISLQGFSQENPNYDPQLAAEYGADDYGMKSYYLVLLTTGENNSTDDASKTAAFAGHMANMEKMVELNKLIVAGPFGENEKGYRGLFILSVKDRAEAKSLLKTDPAIKAGYLGYELLPWYGSAALPAYLPISDKIWKTNP